MTTLIALVTVILLVPKLITDGIEVILKKAYPLKLLITMEWTMKTILKLGVVTTG